jgi:ATP-dependent DNA helicase RecG
MDADEVRRRAAAIEDSRTEFKQVVPGSQPDADDVSKALSAFANSGGGDVFFGIQDDGTISGVGGREDADRLLRHIRTITATGITPSLSVRTLVIDVDGKLVLVARVPEFAPERPFRGKSKYFIRDGNLSREARPDELKRLLTSAPIHYLDEQEVDFATRDDLDEHAVTDFLQTAYPSWRPEQTERYLHALHALGHSGLPTLAGVVLFAKDVSHFLPGAYVSCVRFDSNQATSRFRDRAETRGNVLAQIEGTVAFLLKHVPAPSHVEGMKRVETGVPVEVWREAVTNALTHRDYSSPNQTRIFVFDDRVELLNPGGLLNQLTVESVRLAGTKQPRNPHIANAVSRYALRENLGMGVPEIFRLVAERKLPEPQIEVTGGDFRLTVFTQA